MLIHLTVLEFQTQPSAAITEAHGEHEQVLKHKKTTEGKSITCPRAAPVVASKCAVDLAGLICPKTASLAPSF